MMRRSASRNSKGSVSAGAIPAETLEHSFPELRLPIQPPYPPAEAKSVSEIPSEAGWLYEPKWDGFRCLAFRDDDEVVLQSKAGQPLARYFPEIVEALQELPARRFVLDGEIIIRAKAGLDFDALLQRIHPAASRIQRLSRETPATYLIFDLLVGERAKDLTGQPLSSRRMALKEFAGKIQDSARIKLSPASADLEQAQSWIQQGAASGLDGVVAKRLDCEYTSGERTGMVKIKKIRTVDCVVGGFRWAQKGGEVGSLLLGLYNGEGQLDHVGFSSSFTKADRKKLKAILKPLIGGLGFTGKAPGGPSRWTAKDRNTDWFPLKPSLVCEVHYDHFSGGRFRQWGQVPGVASGEKIGAMHDGASGYESTGWC